MRIVPHCGYWDTTSYPVGGCFHRAGEDGLIVTVIRTFPRTKSTQFCDMEGVTENKSKVVFQSDNADEVKE